MGKRKYGATSAKRRKFWATSCCGLWDLGMQLDSLTSFVKIVLFCHIPFSSLSALSIFFCLFAYYFSTLFSFIFVVKFAPKVLPSLFDLRENPFPSLFFLCIWIRGIMVIEELLVPTIRSEINSRDCLLVLGFDLWLTVEMSLHRVITCYWTTCNPYSHSFANFIVYTFVIIVG